MIHILNYKVLETISDNYKKVVYRCENIFSKEKAILKVLKSQFSTHDEIMRFKKEYSIISELNTVVDGIIKPIRLEEYNGSFVMILEDIGGQSLKSIIADEKLSLDCLLDISIKIVEIIGVIHENGVIHKDIKASNIIWNRQTKEVKVIDFDLAVKLSKDKQDFENNGMLQGSLPYISPEQTGRMNRYIDYRTDFYSLGVVLYELFTGKKPYESQDILEQIYSIIAKEPIPPYELTKGKVSKPLSNIIMKLLEKSPENRYRSSFGIIADLKRCMVNLENFEVGQDDKSSIFQLSQNIYGKEKELDSLLEAFNKSLNEGSQLVLISGEAGVGKTALVNELHKYISMEKGFFINGKFDQYNKGIPYSAIIKAFRKLIIQLLNNDDETLDEIKTSLNNSLKKNGILLTSIIPELEKLIGVQPRLVQLNPTEETNRFFMTFINFIEGMTNNEKPLVLFLDDLQWADISSLHLLEKLLESNSLKNLFIICAFRHNEVSTGHPFMTSIDEIKKIKEVNQIFLHPLSDVDVCNYIADTLCTKTEEIADLCKVIFNKTKGNPFFISEILKDLYKNKFIYFNDRTGRWNWHLDRISELKINDNVVEFLIAKINNLPDRFQKILSLSSSIGNQFDFKMLKLLSGENEKILIDTLIRAVNEDLLNPLNLNYNVLDRYLENTELNFTAIDVSFAFQHDKIQQALYQMIDNETRERLHLKIGRLLLENLSEEEKNSKVIDITTHINKGIKFVNGKEEIFTVINMNFKAAKRAKEAFAYNEVFEFLQIAINLMPPNFWSDQYELALNIYKLYVEAAYLTHNLEVADDAFSLLLKSLKDTMEIAKIYEMQANHYTYLGMMKESIDSIKAGLLHLGIKIPDKVTMAIVGRELVKVKLSLRNETPDKILEKPELKDEKIKLIMRLLICFIPPAFISGQQNLFALAVLKQIQLSLKYGNSPECAGAYIGYSILLSGLGDTKGAFDFGRLAIRINDKFNDLQWRSLVYVLYTLFCHSWNESWDTLEGWYKKAIDSSLSSGDLLYLAHACYYINLWNPSLDIESYLQESDKYIAMIENAHYDEALATAKLAKQKFLSLAGELEDNSSFDGNDFSEKAYLKQLEDVKYYSGIAIYYVYKIQVAFMYENYEKAISYINAADKTIGTLAGSAFIEEFSLYTFLSLAYSYEHLSYVDKVKAKKRMYKEYSRVKKWSKNCPDNFMQHELIMKAEVARICKKNDLAERYYNQAIENSEKGKFIRYKALTHELTAKFYNNRNLKELSLYFFRQASYYYSVWGAKGKVNHLASSYPDISSKTNRIKYEIGNTLSDSTRSVDLNSIIAASQAISKEIELDGLLEALMKIVIQNAGAQKGCIVMRSNSTMLVDGEYRYETDEIVVTKHATSKFYSLPKSIIDHVETKKESLIYDDAASETEFVNDPYIIANKPKSLLCIPLINQNKVTAIIYLENNLVEGAFIDERVKVINLLSREMVFSIENATLYSYLEQSEEKYRELINNMMDGIILIQDRRLKYVNKAMSAMLGYEIEEMLDKSFEKFISEEDLEKAIRYYPKNLEVRNSSFEYEIKLAHRNKIVDVIAIIKTSVVNYLNRPAIQGTVKDITERKRAEEELLKHKNHLEDLVNERTKELESKNSQLNKYIEIIENLSITDELTVLYNRRHFNDILSREVKRCKRANESLTFLMMDIDHFKNYNDTYGHFEGDNVLRQIGSTIRKQIKRGSDYAFRLGGEEFGIIFSGLNPEQSLRFSEQIRQSIEALEIEHKANSVSNYVTVSLGIAVITNGDLKEEDVYKLADNALYTSKTNGKNKVTMIEV